MPKTKISEYSATANSNTDVASINIDEGCAPSGINNAIRAIMGHLKDFQSGTSNDPFTVGSSGSLTLSYGTPYGVAYLNGSKVLTTGSALTFDGTLLRSSTYLGLSTNTTPDTSTGDAIFYKASAGATLSGFNLVFETGSAGSRSEQMRLTSTGLGIGTSSPAYKLDINGTSRMSSGLLIQGSSLTATASQVTIDQLNTTTSRIISWGPNASTAGILYFGNLSSNASVGSASNMVLDSSGNLGLGVTPSANAGLRTLYVSGYNGGYSAIGLGASGGGYGCVGYNLGFTSTDGQIKALASDGMSWIRFQNGAFQFFQQTSATAGTTYTGTQAMTLDASSNLLVAKTSLNAAVVGHEFRTDGQVYSTLSASTNAANATFQAYSTGAGAFRFYVGMGGTVYATSTTITAISDQRLKENIQDIDVGLDAVLALKPRKFDWKAGKGKDKKGDRGWIAQEFEQVFPDMIDTWADPAPEGEEPYKAVNADLIPVLVKAIQEQQAIIQSLTARITALEGA